MKETELNKVLNYMKQYVENKYEHDSEPMLTYKDLQLVLKEIERLQDMDKILRNENINLKLRINKAIEELENIPINAKRKIYHILKGSDKE